MKHGNMPQTIIIHQQHTESTFIQGNDSNHDLTVSLSTAGDNMFSSICLSVRLSVHPSVCQRSHGYMEWNPRSLCVSQ